MKSTENPLKSIEIIPAKNPNSSRMGPREYHPTSHGAIHLDLDLDLDLHLGLDLDLNRDLDLDVDLDLG